MKRITLDDLTDERTEVRRGYCIKREQLVQEIAELDKNQQRSESAYRIAIKHFGKDEME